MSPAVAALLGVIGAFGGFAGFAALRRVRSQNKADQANAENTEADTVGRWESMYGALQERVVNMETEMSKLRDDARAAQASAAEAKLEAQRARTDKAKAETRVAELEADLARALKDAGDERHALRQEFAEYRMEQDTAALAARVRYEAEIAALREEVATLTARLGLEERRQAGRRDDDQRGAAQDVRQTRQDDRQIAQDERESRQDEAQKS